MHLNKKIKTLSIFLFLIINLILIIFSYNKFPGQKIIFIILFIICNLYVFFSFKYSNLFLDKTLSIFLWLGFYYKLTILLITNSGLPEGRGNFSYLPNQYDELLLYSSIGILSFFLSSLTINKILLKRSIYNFYSNNKNDENILTDFYSKYKNLICFSFLILIIFVTVINIQLGFYQKGLLPKNQINLYFGYFIKWMLLFGLTSISCLLIDYDLKKYNNLSKLIIFLFFFELLMTNLSLLSRSLIFTGSALLAAIYFNYEKKIINKKIDNSLIVNFIILFIIFSISIVPINKIRNSSFIDQAFIAEKIVEEYLDNKGQESKKNIEKNDLIEIKKKNIASNYELNKNKIESIVKSDIEKKTKIELVQKNLESTGIHNLDFKKNINRILFVIKNRFVGLDGVATVTSYPDKSFQLLINSINENYNSNNYGFYQRTFVIPFEQKHLIGKEYEKTSERHYGVILPGIISYLSYPGSKIFLFISGFLIFLFCGFLEISAKILSYNSVIFSSLVGYVLGYRLIHFGYLPKQSYLLIGAIIITIFLIKIIKYLIIKFHHAK